MWIFLFASLFCVPLGIFSLRAVDLESVQPVIWLSVLYTAIIGTLVPYFLNAWALARVNPSTVAAFVYLQPVVGFTLAVLFLGRTRRAKLHFRRRVGLCGVVSGDKEIRAH